MQFLMTYEFSYTFTKEFSCELTIGIKMNLMTHPFSSTYFSCIIRLVAKIFGMDKNCFLSFRKDLAKLKEMVKNKSSEEVGFVFSKLVILFIAISAHFSVCASERKQFILHHT